MGYDASNNLSTELYIDEPLYELFDKIDRIKKTTNITDKEAENLLKTKSEFYLQGIYDFGLTAAQMDKIDSPEMRIPIYEMLADKIIKENYEADDNEEFDFGELTDEDRDVARKYFDEIIKEYKIQQASVEDRPKNDLSNLAITKSPKKRKSGELRLKSKEMPKKSRLKRGKQAH